MAQSTYDIKCRFRQDRSILGGPNRILVYMKYNAAARDSPSPNIVLQILNQDPNYCYPYHYNNNIDAADIGSNMDAVLISITYCRDL